MKKYPKLAQIDARGVIVVPKDVRRALDIEEGDGFWVYAVGSDGLFLQKVNRSSLDDANSALNELQKNASKINLDEKSITTMKNKYKKRTSHNLEVIE